MTYRETANNHRIYPIDSSCIFKKNKEAYGGLSNMASIYPIEINGIKIKSSEALYQSCKFPHDFELQKKIIEARSPYITKMIAKGKATRYDWMKIRVKVMKWCIRIKLAQNYYSFGELLMSTKGRNIVENSDRDLFWGAKRVNDFEFQGINALGRLLMELREEYFNKSKEEMIIVESPNLDEFCLLGKKIEKINMKKKYGS